MAKLMLCASLVVVLVALAQARINLGNRRPGGLGSRCRKNSDCDVSYGRCHRGECVCNPGFYGLGTRTCLPTGRGSDCRKSYNRWACEGTEFRCIDGSCRKNDLPPPRRGQPKLGDYCANDAGCAGIQNGRCAKNYCVCQKGTTSQGTKRCVATQEHSSCDGRVNRWSCEQTPYRCVEGRCVGDRVLGSTCSTEQQCDGIAYARCFKGKCVCEEGFFGNAGGKSCQNAGVNSPCSGDINAGACKLDGSISCRDGRCKKDLQLGSRCRNNGDCAASVWGGQCYNYVCSCKSGFTARGLDDCERAEEGSSCTGVSSRACDKDSNLDCNGRTCESAPVLGDRCKKNRDCNGISSSVCRRSKCVCEPGSTEQSPRSCEPAGEGSSCAGPISTWACERDASLSCDDETNTCEAAPKLGDSCGSVTDCYGISNAACNGGTCTCAASYTQGNGQRSCVKAGQGSSCALPISGWACEQPGLSCVANRCQYSRY